VDDLVLAVYSEEYGSYKIIHKTSNYLHFVHSAILKNYEQRLSFKTTGTPQSPVHVNKLHFPGSMSPPSSNMMSMVMAAGNVDMMQSQIDVQRDYEALSKSPPTTRSAGVDGMTSGAGDTSCLVTNESMMNVSTVFKNSPPSDSNVPEHMFFNDKQLPHWFIGKVLLKEFCVARKVFFHFFFNFFKKSKKAAC
jgi:hypothetical protein